MSDLIQMNQDPISYPPQMRSGGSPPAHLSLSLDSNAVVECAVAMTAAAMKSAMDLVVEKASVAFASSWAAMLAELMASISMALAELVPAAEQSRQESADCAAVSAESTLTNEHRCWEAAERSTTLEKTALVEERCGSFCWQCELRNWC
jgi:hypothetical protein